MSSSSMLSKHVRATATVLHEEFLVPFKVYDAGTAAQLWPEVENKGDSQFPTDHASKFASLVGSRKVEVTQLPSGKYQLRVPFVITGGTLVAEAVMPRISRSSDSVTDEQWRLEKWGQAVLDRLLQIESFRSQRSAEEELKRQLKHAWELNLTIERQIRHVRIHRNVDQSIGNILEGLPFFVAAGCVAWVPNHFESVQIRGKTSLPTEVVCKLAKALRHDSNLRESSLLMIPKMSDSKWGQDFPQLDSVLVMTVPSQKSFGWLIAIRTSGETDPIGFRNSDAASMAPFAALIGFVKKACDRHQELKDLLVGLTRSLASAVDAKDPYTYGHSERVARIAVELGREMQLSDDELSDLYLAGLLHDVGKIGVKDEVLSKRGPLTPEETLQMQRHPEIGHSILQDLHQLRSLLPGVLHHHERFDGAGYPAKLAGEEIPQIARILAVADSYDAMSTSRPYRQSLAPDQVEQILIEGSGLQWDPHVIDTFQRIVPKLRTIRQHGLGESLRNALEGALRDTGSSRIIPANLALSVAKM